MEKGYKIICKIKQFNEMEFQPPREQFTLPLNNYNERGSKKTGKF